MNYNIENDILTCKVLCSERKLTELNVPSTVWLDYSFDFSQIYGLKNTEWGKDEDYKGTTGIYIGAEYFIIQMPYCEMLKEWKKYKAGNIENEINKILRQ